MLDIIRRPGENPLLTYLLTYCLTSARRCAHESLRAQTGDDEPQSRTGTLGLYLDGSGRRNDSPDKPRSRSDNKGLVGSATTADCNRGVGYDWVRWGSNTYICALQHHQSVQQDDLRTRTNRNKRRNDLPVERYIRRKTYIFDFESLGKPRWSKIQRPVYQDSHKSVGVTSKAVAA